MQTCARVTEISEFRRRKFQFVHFRKRNVHIRQYWQRATLMEPSICHFALFLNS